MKFFLNSNEVRHKTIEVYLVDKNEKFLIHLTQFGAPLYICWIIWSVFEQTYMVRDSAILEGYELN